MTILKVIKDFDQKVAFYMTRFYKHKFLNDFMKFISSCGDFGLSWLIIILITNRIPASRKMSIDMLIALISATLIGQIGIKSLVKRKRPCHNYPQVKLLIPIPTDLSFPSGHTTSSFACSTVMMYFFPTLGILGYIYAFSTAISRLYLFVHYLSDVIAGMILGIIIGIVICML